MTLTELLGERPYVAYPYTYPHKTAYRAFDPPLPLSELWASERREALFLYIHVPFCEVRCGYCNLFTLADPPADLQAAYLEALRRQVSRTRAALGEATFARFALGGGTPTCLDVAGLAALLDLVEGELGADLAAIPACVECSPRTATAAKLRLLRARGVDRVSVGVQSFVPAEVRAAGRRQSPEEVAGALARIRAAGFPTLNLDLIYGLPGQTVESWRASIEAALRFAPEELYLYPLYVRPLTGLDRAPQAWDDVRMACYRAGRDRLLEAGYRQISMRMFRAPHAPEAGGPVYCCQEDGMVGLGAGARSYTRRVHYSGEYAVARPGVRAILEDYVARPEGAFDFAHHGFRLDREELRRRYVLKSLFRVAGLDLPRYRAAFSSEPEDDLPELRALFAAGIAVRSGGSLRLTPEGLAWTDAIGPYLYSARVRRLLAEYDPR